MAPIKFEENIKDKLEQRTLQPSSKAWAQLSERLDAEPRKKKKSYWWLGIAASFVGLLIVSSIFFTKDSEGIIEAPVIVEEDVKKDIEDKMINDETGIEKQETEAPQIVLEEPAKRTEVDRKQPVKQSEVVPETKVEVALVVKQNEPENQLKDTSVEALLQEELNKINSEVTLDQSAEDLKVNQVVAQIKQLQKEKSTVSDAEIDALLNQAQKELMSKRLFDETTRTVDAELLLQEAELGAEQSFRNRVFEALKSSYETVKTSVAERNN